MNGDSEDLRRMTPPDYPRELSLLSENQRLREEVERLREDNRKLAEEVGRNAVTVVGLQAEVERLREAVVDHEALAGALRRIAEYDSDEAIFYVDIARAALDGKEEA